MRDFKFFNLVIDLGMLPSKLVFPIHNSVNKEKLEILQEKIHFASEIQKKILNDTATSNDEAM